MQRGYIKLYRCIRDNHFWHDRPFDRCRAWIDLLMLANHVDGFLRIRGISVEVKRGQVGWSEIALAEKWGWSRGKVRRLLKDLSEKQQIVQQNTKLTSLITIINYELYQSDGTTGGTTDDTTDGQQTDNKQYPKKELKKEEKENNKDIVPPVKPSKPAPKKTDEEWLLEIKSNPAYQGLNFDVEIGKAQAWCMTKGRKCSRQFLLNWFNRAEKNTTLIGQQTKAGPVTFAEAKFTNMMQNLADSRERILANANDGPRSILIADS